jgi:hypothetical protein
MLDFLRTRSLSQLAGVGMVVAGILAFAYQAVKNATVAARFSEGWMVYVDAAGGAAVELFVAAAAIGIISLANQGKVANTRALAGLMALCVVFGVFAASQQINVGRAEKSAEVGLAQSNLSGRKADLDRARAEVATMAAIPSVATAQAAIDRLKTRKGWAETNGCAIPGSFTVLCRQVADANAMLGRANRKAQLEAEVSRLSTVNEATSGRQVAAADPMATFLANRLNTTEANAQLIIAVFNAVTMMLLGMFGVHFGLLVYGFDHDTPTPARTAEVHEFKPANDIRSHAITDVARETPIARLSVGKAILPARAA